MLITILVNPKSQYGVISHFEKGLQEAFTKQGIEIVEYAIDQDLPRRLLDSSSDYTLGINIALPDSLARVPHLAYMIDWATYTPALFSSQQTIVCSVDKQCAFFLEQSGVKSLFLPHAVPEKVIIEKEIKRDLDIVFAGSFMDEKPLLQELKRCLSPSFFEEVEEMMTRSLASATHNHVQGLSECLKENPKYVQELEEKHFSFLALCNVSEQIMRARDRLSLLQAIDREIHIYGDHSEAWKQALESKKKGIFHKKMEFKEIPALFQRAKIILNSAPMFKEGLHERFLYGIANGASVITNRNAFLPLDFPENQAVYTFLSPHYELVNEGIAMLLDNEEKREEDIQQAQTIIRSRHTWDQRVSVLIKVLKMSEKK